MGEILKTTDYGMFKKHRLNREVIKSHVKKIKTALEQENRLDLHPIIINKEYEIISGQHRFEAAKELGLPIFYIKDDKVSDDQILAANMYQRRTSTADVIEFYAKRGDKPDYILLQKYLRRLGLSGKGAIALLTGTLDGKKMVVSDGSFVFPKDRSKVDKVVDDYLQFTAWTDEKKVRPSLMFKSYNFTIAFRKLALHPEFNLSFFLSRCEHRHFLLKPQATYKDWFELLVNIYNYKNRNRVYVEDGEDAEVSTGAPRIETEDF